MRQINCIGCQLTHERTPVIKHMKHPETGIDGWFCSRWFNDVSRPKITEEMRENAIDMIQPFRDGVLSKEYTQMYPSNVKNMINRGEIKQSDVSKAKNVWTEREFRGWESRIPKKTKKKGKK